MDSVLWKPLPSTSSVRVLRLLQHVDSFQQPLNCAFETLEIDNRPSTSYGALSYAWGDSQLESTITVDGHEVAIRRNLYMALCHIWNHDPELPIWADALSINQADDAEKTSQVSKMSEIFSHAAMVFFWLAMPALHTNEAWEMLEAVQDYPPEEVEQLAQVFQTREDAVVPLHSGSILNRDLEHALYDLLRRPWWLRVWTFQEALLAQEATVCCGSLRMEWGRFLASWRFYYEDYDSFPRRFEIDTSLGPIWNGNALCSNKSQALFEMLKATQRRKATDPRDKVYALLGFLQLHDVYPMKPKYWRSSTVVYTKAARACIRMSETLDVLRAAGTMRSEHHKASSTAYISPVITPSWVANWDMLSHQGPLKPIRSETTTKPVILPASDESRIGIRGQLVATFCELGPDHREKWRVFQPCWSSAWMPKADGSHADSSKLYEDILQAGSSSCICGQHPGDPFSTVDADTSSPKRDWLLAGDWACKLYGGSGLYFLRRSDDPATGKGYSMLLLGSSDGWSSPEASALPGLESDFILE